MGLVALCCPFAWYYLNEARPYAIQLSASMVCVCRVVIAFHKTAT